jgi:ElaB/YqjD/DUF883 family membrane-anchored ribosome-binding protein
MVNQLTQEDLLTVKKCTECRKHVEKCHNQINKAKETVIKYVDEHPRESVAIAAGIGALLGIILIKKIVD